MTSADGKASLQSPHEPSRSPAAPLRVALLIDSYVQPRWKHKVIADILSSRAAGIVLIIKNDALADARQTLRDRMRGLMRQRKLFLYKLYSRLDRYLFKQQPDAFEEIDIQPLISQIPVINVTPSKKKFTDYFSDQDVASIREYELDVAIRFGFRILKGDALRIAKHGVWSYHHGDNLMYRGGPPGFWEVMQGHPFTGAVLQVLSEKLDDGQVIYRSFAETDKRSVARNTNNYFWQSAAFVTRKLRDLHESGPCALKDASQADWNLYSNRLYKAPTNGEMIRVFSRFAAKYLHDKITHALYFKQWFLAYKINSSGSCIDDTFYNFKRLVPPKDRFWADPFPFKKDGKYYIFFEELLYKTRKGHLSVVEVDEKGITAGPYRILERPYHLSYPFVFSWDGELYMMPETSKAGTVELYRCTSFPDKWDFDRVLFKDVRAVDATLAEIGGRWWMFVGMEVEGARELYELHLFYADTPLGEWKSHKRNPIKTDVRSARPAGHLIRKKSELYRPAQVGPGYAMSINRIERLDHELYLETEVSKILPGWSPNLVGMHTLNNSEGLTVIDGQLQRRRYF